MAMTIFMDRSLSPLCLLPGLAEGVCCLGCAVLDGEIHAAADKPEQGGIKDRAKREESAMRGAYFLAMGLAGMAWPQRRPICRLFFRRSA